VDFTAILNFSSLVQISGERIFAVDGYIRSAALAAIPARSVSAFAFSVAIFIWQPREAASASTKKLALKPLELEQLKIYKKE
jgi:hypothetical protein